jgi:pantoate--beta-alanine ligase
MQQTKGTRMQLVHQVKALQALADRQRAEGRTIALVPTMGALHEGHLALVDAARARADLVWVSIFVNPSQFDQRRDLVGYPRPLEADLARCRERGVEAVFVPDEGELYPEGHQTWVQVSELERPLCGAARPGHFRGVASVVTRLLIAARPHVAVFGEKDWQQLALIRRLVRDLCFDVDVVGVPTVRAPDGLALSSRNIHLTGETRPQALALVRALGAAEAAVSAGECDQRRLLGLVRQEIGKSPLAEIDYAELRHPDSLAVAPETLAGPTLLALAVRFPRRDAGPGESVRLIDNRVLQVADSGLPKTRDHRAQARDPRVPPARPVQEEAT